MPLELDPIPVSDLNDINYGAWQGLSHEEVASRQPEAYEVWKTTPERAAIPGGEPLSAVAERVGRALQHLVARHAGQTLILIGHDGTNRLVLLRILGLPVSQYRHLRQDPCGISVLENVRGQWNIRSLNETAHLPLSLAPSWDLLSSHGEGDANLAHADQPRPHPAR